MKLRKSAVLEREILGIDAAALSKSAAQASTVTSGNRTTFVRYGSLMLPRPTTAIVVAHDDIFSDECRRMRLLAQRIR
jgi:hypothetical protein